MPTYMIQANYTPEAGRAVIQEGASRRRTVVERLVAGMGGHLKFFYFAFGDVDAYGVAELPDTLSAAATAMAINTSGSGVTVRTVVLLTCEEVDAAAVRMPAYRGPGQ